MKKIPSIKNITLLLIGSKVDNNKNSGIKNILKIFYPLGYMPSQPSHIHILGKKKKN